MAHTHDVHDTGKRFEINGISRFIKETSATKLVLVQGDHKSEVVTFEMPRFIDGHDMLLCDKIRVHYINIETQTSNSSADIYEVTDLKLCEDCEEEEILLFTWTIEAPATKYFGSLSFLVKFECTEGDNILYQWNTARYVNINVLSGIDNSEAFVDKYSNVLEEWYNELTKGADSIEELKNQSLSEIELAKEDAKKDVEEEKNKAINDINEQAEMWTTIDQTYNPKSENAQSGRAIASELNNYIPQDFEIILDGGNAGGEIQVDYTVDSYMSDTSEHPVQNKVIKQYIDNIEENLIPDAQMSNESEHPVQNKVVKQYIDSFQNNLNNQIDKMDLSYIVSTGSSNGWTYRKWSDGVGECWFYGTIIITLSKNSDGNPIATSIEKIHTGECILTTPITFTDKNQMMCLASCNWQYTEWVTGEPKSVNEIKIRKFGNGNSCGWNGSNFPDTHKQIVSIYVKGQLKEE